MTPKLRTPDEHSFCLRGIELARESFGEVSVEFFTFLALATTPFRNLSIFPHILAVMEKIDAWLFNAYQMDAEICLDGCSYAQTAETRAFARNRKDLKSCFFSPFEFKPQYHCVPFYRQHIFVIKKAHKLHIHFFLR